MNNEISTWVCDAIANPAFSGTLKLPSGSYTVLCKTSKDIFVEQVQKNAFTDEELTNIATQIKKINEWQRLEELQRSRAFLQYIEDIKERMRFKIQ